MPARDNIFARIRAARGIRGPILEAERLAVSQALASPVAAPPLGWTGEPVARFRAQAQGVAATVDDIASLGEVPAAVARYLDTHALPRELVVWPSLADLDWAGHGLTIAVRAARDADAVGITGAFCGIAETGTLMTLSGAARPASISLLPATHIVVLPAVRIVRTVEDAWALLRRERTGDILPRAVNFISGPSRTADIEQTVTLGAHGPYRVHVLIVAPEGAPAA